MLSDSDPHESFAPSSYRLLLNINNVFPGLLRLEFWLLKLGIMEVLPSVDYCRRQIFSPCGLQNVRGLAGRDGGQP